MTDQAQDAPATALSQLLSLMAALRDPDTGCPWDVAQDFRLHRAIHHRGSL